MDVELISIVAVAFILGMAVATFFLRNLFGSEKIEQIVRDEIRTNRDESAKTGRELREEVASAQKSSAETTVNRLSEIGSLQKDKLESVEKRIKELSDSNESRIGKLRDTLEVQLKSLQESNQEKLDQMRRTVDEKLQSTLEKRLGESFKFVSDRLEAVQRGLGEMQNLAAGVGDLKRVLTNVKIRGTWGEVQLGTLLEQILTPDQYAQNVQTREGSADMVEYAIRLPGTDSNPTSSVWVPIDSKFPQEDYQRLVDAANDADVDAVEKATAALTRAVQNSAKTISEKYLDPPRTTDFAIMFLPTEGLYAEIIRQPGLFEKLQQTYRVIPVGPNTLSVILNSFRMGFRTLAIEQRSSEVWRVLAAVKMEFGKFGDTLGTLKKQLNTASNTIDSAGVRTRAMQRKLRDVEELPLDASENFLGFSDDRE